MKYETLDKAICLYFRTRRGHPTNNDYLLGLASSLTNGEPWRLIDRRIQAMRRSGRISYNNNLRTWTVND